MSRITGRTATALRAAGLLVATGMAACTPIERFHGFVPTETDLAAVQVGEATRETVLATFGPPTTEGTLENDAFYYVSSQFRTMGPFAPEEIDRQVLEIDFAPNGVVRNITRYTLEDGQVVVLDRRVTEDGINDVTFLGQLLGSFGRIDAGALLGDDPGTEF